MNVTWTLLRAFIIAGALALGACSADRPNVTSAGNGGGGTPGSGTTGGGPSGGGPSGGGTPGGGTPGGATPGGGTPGQGNPPPASPKLCGDLTGGVDVALVLDSSGSMGAFADGISPPTRMEVARDGAEGMAQRLGSGDRSALVDYDTSARLVQALTFNHADTIAKIRLLVDNGSTNPGDALFLARNELVNNGRPGAHKILIHETDGIPNAGPDPLTEAEAAKRAGIEFFAIGIGDGINEADLRKQVSAPEDRHYFNARNAQEILQAFNLVGSTLGARTLTAVAGAYVARGFGSLAMPAVNHQVFMFDQGEPANNKAGGATATPPVSSPPGAVQLGGGGGSTSASGAVPADLTRAATEARSRPGAISILANGAEVLGLDAGDSHAAASGEKVQGVAQFSDSNLASTAVNLRIMGQSIPLPVPPNTEFMLPGVGRVVINEQTAFTSSAFGGRSINLAHLYVTEGPPGELIIGHAFAGVSCVNPTPFPPE